MFGVTGVKWVLNYRVSAKFCRNVFPNLIRNLTAIPLMVYSGIRSIEGNLIQEKQYVKYIVKLPEWSVGKQIIIIIIIIMMMMMMMIHDT